MKVLVTAGATQVPIDKVRCITNVFTGRTGNWIAEYFFGQGDDVLLITSNKQTPKNVRIAYYKTFDELMQIMQKEITTGQYEIIIHSAAVSDFKVAGVYNSKLNEIDALAKISSDNQELFLKMVPTPKIIDLIREPWGFAGALVKFKLQVNATDQELIEIGYKSLLHSNADFLVANCLERMHQVIIINSNGEASKMSRRRLPEELYRRTR